jgi:hypothetical protein
MKPERASWTTRKHAIIGCLFLLIVWIALWIYTFTMGQATYTMVSHESKTGRSLVAKFETLRASSRIVGAAYETGLREELPRIDVSDQQLQISDQAVRSLSNLQIAVIQRDLSVRFITLEPTDFFRDHEWKYRRLPIVGVFFADVGWKPIHDLTDSGWDKVDLAIRSSRPE